MNGMSEKFKLLKEMIEILITTHSKVFIVGHDGADFDSIGSAVGLKTLSNILGKEAYIVINDNEETIDPGVKKIIEDHRADYNIITLKDYQKLKDNESLLIMTDVNKKSMISLKDNLNEFESIVIIDHHKEGEDTVNTGYKFISPDISSSSEIVAQILNSYKTKYNKDVANHLLAGIVLDTKRYTKNTTSKTHDVAEKLINKGADYDYVNRLFLMDFEVARKISNLIFYNTNTLLEKYQYSMLQTNNISFTINREKPTTIYRKEEIAAAADNMLDFEVDAAFVMGYIDSNTISISARSKANIDVSEIMKQMGGGGNQINAGCKIKSEDIFEVEKDLMSKVPFGFDLPEEIDVTDKPSIQKILK